MTKEVRVNFAVRSFQGSSGAFTFVSRIQFQRAMMMNHVWLRAFWLGFFFIAGVLFSAALIRKWRGKGGQQIMDDHMKDSIIEGSDEAWEVQDTLLQDFQGLLLTFHVAAERVALNHKAKPLLNRALTCADQVILDARKRIEHCNAGRSGYSEEQKVDPPYRRGPDGR